MKQHVAELFNQWANSERGRQMVAGHQKALNPFLTQIYRSIVDSFSLLDIGCGNGWLVKRFAVHPHCQEAWGIDVAQNMIAKASHNHLPHEHYVTGNFTNWPFNRKFEFIISIEALYYAIDLPETTKKIYQTLTDNGQCVIAVDFYQENPESQAWQQHVGLEMHYLSIKEWCSLFKQAGFKKVTHQQIKCISGHNWQQQYGSLVIQAIK